jgi:hypothetical protein
MTVMFLILLGLFLTLAAFALDLGNLYLWRLRLDKAARAGSMAGLGFRGVQGWDYVKPGGAGEGALIDATKQAVQDNLKAYGVEVPLQNITVNYASDTDSISVGINHTPPTILIGKLDKIMGFGFNSQTDASGNPIPQSSTLSLSQQHQANLNRANVVLLIDVSGSMLCPAPGQDPAAYPVPCSCRRANACGSAITKLDKLADGVERFAKHFNPNQDRISVIAFNLAAQQLYSIGNKSVMKDATSPNPLLAGTTAHEFLTNQKNNLRTVLKTLAGSNTNHCDALAEGIRELETLSVQLFGNDAGGLKNDRRQLQPFLVFFTDGAPNAMRGIFSTADIPNGQCDTYTTGSSNGTGTASRTPGGACGTRDFYHYALEWVAVDGGVTKQYRGPGPFVARAVDTDNIPLLFNFPIAGNQVAPNGSKTCGVEIADGNPTKFEQTVTRKTGGGAGARGSPTGCLSPSTTTFSFSIPYTNPDTNGGFTSSTYGASVTNVPISTTDTTWRDPNWPSTFFSGAATAYGLQKYDELPYYCAIEAADYIRTRFGGTIFVVGLGTADAHSTNKTTAGAYTQDATCNDPLQDPDDHTSRKDFFLARLAFARSMFTNQLLPLSMRSHYQIAGPQTSRAVSTCSDHRLNKVDPPAKLPDPPRIGYTSADGLTDAGTTYTDLRPARPAIMDSLVSGTGQTGSPLAGARRIDTQGEYFPTDNANDIPRIFDLIAKTILLRSAS